MPVTIAPLKQLIGAKVGVEKARLLDDDAIASMRAALEQRGVLVFPGIGISDAEQLALTDRLGGRLGFGQGVPGVGATSPDVYRITLDATVNTEPDYVYGTFFWHVDGASNDFALPKATVLSARHVAEQGGATEFANLYAAYEALPDAEKAEIATLEAIHTVEAAVRPAFGRLSPERIERYARIAPGMVQPLVWTHGDGRRSLLVGTHAEGIVGMPGPHARALLARLLQWAAQPDFVYRHEWQPGDLVIWDNQALMHRVEPYSDASRVMHRTVVAGSEQPGHRAEASLLAGLYAAG